MLLDHVVAIMFFFSYKYWYVLSATQEKMSISLEMNISSQGHTFESHAKENDYYWRCQMYLVDINPRAFGFRLSYLNHHNYSTYYSANFEYVLFKGTLSRYGLGFWWHKWLVRAWTDLFENHSVNSLEGDLSNATTFNPPLFSLVNTFKMLKIWQLHLHFRIHAFETKKNLY